MGRTRLATRSKKLTRVCRKKSVLQMALGYAVAWAFVWVPFFIHLRLLSFEIAIVSSIFVPLQGLYNFIVFMAPKVRYAKKARRGQQGELSWSEAVFKAYMSRGERRTRT